MSTERLWEILEWPIYWTALGVTGLACLLNKSESDWTDLSTEQLWQILVQVIGRLVGDRHVAELLEAGVEILLAQQSLLPLLRLPILGNIPVGFLMPLKAIYCMRSLSVYLSIYWPLYLFLYLSINPSIHLSIYPSIH